VSSYTTRARARIKRRHPVDSEPESVDNLGNTPHEPLSPNVSDPSDTVGSMTTGLVETHLMKSGEVRDLLHIGRTTLHDWRTEGLIRGVRHTPRGPWYYPANQPVIEAALRAVGSIR
jgi:hypothetical protein